MTTRSPEVVAAYVDGELDPRRRAELEQEIATDPELAQRVASERALRDRVQAAFAAALDEPVPDRLRQVIAGSPPQAPGDVVDLADVRASRRASLGVAPRRWGWGALAASVLLGFVTARLLPGSGGEPFETATDGRLVARGPVGEALSRQLASDDTAGKIGVQISFVDDQGRFCRTFTTDQIAGLACRQGSEWAVHSLAQARASTGSGSGMRTAGTSLPASILAEIEGRIRGEPLDAKAERAARDARWQR